METTVVYTYIIRAGSIFKIGKSKDPKKRLAQLRTASPMAKLIYFGHSVSESAIHKMFANKRIGGEWFKLSQGDVAKIIRLMNDGTCNMSNKEMRYSKYTVNFGKYSGVKLVDMKSSEHVSYMKWYVKQHGVDKFIKGAFMWKIGCCIVDGK